MVHLAFCFVGVVYFEYLSLMHYAWTGEERVGEFRTGIMEASYHGLRNGVKGLHFWWIMRQQDYIHRLRGSVYYTGYKIRLSDIQLQTCQLEKDRIEQRQGLCRMMWFKVQSPGSHQESTTILVPPSSRTRSHWIVFTAVLAPRVMTLYGSTPTDKRQLEFAYLQQNAQRQPTIADPLWGRFVFVLRGKGRKNNTVGNEE